MRWIALESADQIQQIKQQAGYSIIFKHSTRCSISMMAKRKFELDWSDLPEDMDCYFLDLIKYRELSAQVAHADAHQRDPRTCPVIGQAPEDTVSPAGAGVVVDV